MHYRGANVEPYLSSAKRFRTSQRPQYDLSWHGIKTMQSRAAKEGTKAYSLVFQMVAGPPFSCCFAAEHSSVMRIGLVSSYISR